MQVRIYVPGAPLYKEDSTTGRSTFIGRSTASFRDPFVNRKEMLVLLGQEIVGRALQMEKVKIGDEPLLCFLADITLENPSHILQAKLDGYLAEASGSIWTSGLFIRKLHLQTEKKLKGEAL